MNDFWNELNRKWRWIVGSFVFLYGLGTVFAFTYLIWTLWNDAPIIIYSMAGVSVLFIGFMAVVFRFYEWLYKDIEDE